MPDVAQITDRITELLQKKGPSGDDVARGLFRSIAKPGSYGNALSALKKERINQQRTLLDTLNVQSQIETREATKKQKAIELEIKRDALEYKKAKDLKPKRTTFMQDFDFLTKEQGHDADSALGILKPGFRGTDLKQNAKFLVDELGITMKDAVDRLKPPKTTKDSPITVGNAASILAEYTTYRRTGQEVPPALLSRAIAAAHILKKPQIYRDADGVLRTMTTGVPKGLVEPSIDVAPQEDGVTDKPGEGVQTRVLSQKATKKIDQALQTIDEIADLLAKAKKENRTITGWKGWLKANLGGAARQVGIPISPDAKDLARKLDIIALLSSRDFLNESRASDTERDKLKQVIGRIHALDDDTDLRSSLSDVVHILYGMKGGSPK